jgi:hypothetical protein
MSCSRMQSNCQQITAPDALLDHKLELAGLQAAAYRLGLLFDHLSCLVTVHLRLRCSLHHSSTQLSVTAWVMGPAADAVKKLILVSMLLAQ